MSHLQKNLAALSPLFPAFATTIQSAQIPDGFAPTPGTDGTPTFSHITTADGRKRVEWLGHTSMPAAAARPIIASLDAHAAGQNGLGLSIGTGFGWAALIAKLHRSQMLYVYEPDAALLRLALEVCELSALLADRRLILLTGSTETAARELAAFLAAHPGFEPPTVLHPLPTLVGARRNELLTAGEAVVRHAVLERQALLGKLQERVVTLLPQTPPGEAAAVAFLLTPRYPAERPVQQEAARLGAMTIHIDHHDTASGTLRLQVLGDHIARGPVRILSDMFRQQLAAIPPEVPVETWIPPLVGPAYWDHISPALAPQDRIVVHFGHHALTLQNRGIPANFIDIRPLTPPENQKSKMGGGKNQKSPPRRIAMLADLPPSDAPALGITLPTHQAVFAALCAMVIADYLTVHPGMAPDFLRRALVRAGIDPKIDDPALKDPMLRILREVLIPSLPPLTLAAALARQGHPLTLIGDWPGLQTTLADIRLLPFDQYTPAAWDDVALYAHLSPQGVFSPLLWEALAAGVAIVAPEHPVDRLAGTLPQLLKALPAFHHPKSQHFLSTIKASLIKIQQTP